MQTRTITEIVIILVIVVIVGVLYNLSSPTRLPFIAEERQFNFSQSDSLLKALQKQDSIEHAADSIKNLSIRREDSLRKNQIKLDSIRRVSDSLKTITKKRTEDSLKALNNTASQDFTKPIDIRLDFAKALFDKHYQFIDARDESDYKAGTIQGAMNIPYHKLDQFKDKLNALPKEKVYVVFCSASCDVSIDLAYAMAKMGFNKLYIFHGGWDEWKNAGYPAN
ncbi:MAG: rhodanese-like domain-containing protein [Ignavibacteria bacterium]